MKSITAMTKLFGCGIIALLLISQESAAEQIFCGKALTNVLENICVDGYNMIMSEKKRSVTLPAYGVDSELGNSIVPLPYNSLLADKMFGEAANMMTKTRRRRHGVYDECCLKGCSYLELMGYCL